MRKCTDNDRPNDTAPKRLISLLAGVVLALLMVLTVWVFAVRLQGGYPSFFGYRLLRIATGSMTPEYEIGDVILVRKTPANELSIGDDITYLSAEGETKGLLVTHRIIAIDKQADAGYSIQTEGIAEGAVPDPAITEEQIYGKVIRTCRILTRIYGIFLTRPGLFLFLIPLVVMMYLEVMNLLVIWKEGDTEYVQTKDNKQEDEQT